MLRRAIERPAPGWRTPGASPPSRHEVPGSDLRFTWLIGNIMGLYGDNGKEHGNYFSIIGIYWGYSRGHGNLNPLSLILHTPPPP